MHSFRCHIIDVSYCVKSGCALVSGSLTGAVEVVLAGVGEPPRGVSLGAEGKSSFFTSAMSFLISVAVEVVVDCWLPVLGETFSFA